MFRNVSLRPLTLLGRFQYMAIAICCEERVALGRAFQPALQYLCQRRTAIVTHSFIYPSETVCNLSS
jgi:hypothetical protein